MKMKNISVLLVIVCIVSFMMVTVSAPTYYSVLNNPYFNNSSNWVPDIWTASRSWHSYSIQNGVATTRAAIWGSYNEWGNTEYEQGKDPWRTYGSMMYETPLLSNLQLTTRAKVTEKHCDWLFGQVNAYVEFWVEFDEPTGIYGYRWAELQIFLDSHHGWFNPCLARRNSYAVRTAENSWYHVMYRGIDIGSYWTTRTYDINGLISKLASTWNVDLNKGRITCVTFGVEGCKGEMTTMFDYVDLKVLM